VNYVAAGVLLPLPLAGDPALELCNTFAGWDEDAGREYLLSYEHRSSGHASAVSSPTASRISSWRKGGRGPRRRRGSSTG
jgi:hypothetical protein